MIRHLLRRSLFGIGCALIALGIGYAALIGYLGWSERIAPSTRQVLVLGDNRRIPLVQPAGSPEARGSLASRALSTSYGLDDVSIAGVSRSSREAMLPPERLVIPRIKLDRPVVLSTVDHLPQTPVVGWLMGSAFPGYAGNLVLYGHLGGKPGVFMRLHELSPGDEFSVFTQHTERRYRVRSVFETTPDDVVQMAPTDTATATLITCSGPWDPINQTNSRRLIVKADYVEPASK